MGHLIPAGTGLKKYTKILLSSEVEEPEETQEEEVQTK
jgi:hypothetical protein